MSLKSWLHESWYGEYAISLLHCVECKIFPKICSDEKAVKKYYKKKTGKTLDLEHPVTYSEKMNWYKLYGKDPLMAKCADKIAVRDYVQEKGCGEYLNEIYGIYENAWDIDLDKLPERFVIKAAHGSAMNVIVKHKDEVDWKKTKRLMNTWLKQDIYWSGREWVYKDIPKRLVIEKYLEDKKGELRDYKFFCFNGEPCYLEVDYDRFVHHRRVFFDMDFHYLSIKCEKAFGDVKMVEKPEQFEKMKWIAKRLASEFQHVRVDLYMVDEKIYFGELTFFHNSGFAYFENEADDYEFGSKWLLRK